MALNFPNSPADGDLATLNGTTFQYNSAKNLWDPVTEELTTTSDTPPGSPSNGQTWFDTTNGTLYVYYDDGTSSQWVGVTGPQGESATGGGPSGNTSSSSVTTYSTISELPLIGSTTGDQAFVSGNNRLYIWNGTGWYNIALINTSPTITQGGAGSYELATDGTPTVITLTATDPEGIPITWSYSVTSGSLSNGGGTTATVTQADNVFTITPTTNTDYAGSFILTFTASDGVNLATDTNSFSLVFVTLVQNSKYTSALITTDGSTGNNTTFTDSSSNALTITSAGTPSSQSFSPYRSGGYSVEIDASAGSWIQAQSHSDFAFGTGDFTVEFWMKSQKSDQWLLLIDQQYQAQGVSIWINPTNELIYYPNSSTPALTSQALTMSDWIHVALVRNSGTTKFYVNGVWNSTSYSDSQNFPTNLPLKMGSSYSAASYGYKGYFRDVRVTNTAVYSTDFTPPTEPLTEIAGTRLLTCQSPTFKDESTTPHTIDITGTPSIVPVGPYDYDEYNPSNHGGSIYFDGSSYLQNGTAYGSIFDYSSSIPFTIDMWFYPTTSGTSLHIASMSNGTVDANLNWLFRQKTDNTLRFVMIDQSGTVVTCDSTDLMNINAWNHVAVVMTGSSIKHWLNGAFQQEVSFTGSKQVNGDIQIGQWANTFYQGYITDFRWNVGEQVYTGTADITPPTEPLSSTNATLHVKGTGANIIDKSQSSNNITLVGDTTASTTESKYAGSSISFDGIGDYLKGSASSIYDMGAGDFTVEFWTKTPGLSNSPCLVAVTSGAGASLTQWGIFAKYASTTSIDVYLSNGTSYFANTGGGNILDGEWHHVAFSRDGASGRLFLDGVQVGSTLSLSTTELGPTGKPICVGSQNGSYNFNGYIEDVRITKGLARYTTNFTPPTGSLEG